MAKMKLLHTSDWHLGKKLEQYSRLEEQREVLEEIVEIAEEEAVDAVLIAGDLYDTFNPPIEAVELFFHTLKRLSNNGKRAVICIAGNHDSPDRIEAPSPLAWENGIIFAGYPHTQVRPFNLSSGLRTARVDKGFLEMFLPQKKYPLRLLLTPYANEYRMKRFLGKEDYEEELRRVLENEWQSLASKYCDKQGVNVLLTHLFLMEKGGEAEEEPEGEREIMHVGASQAIYTQSIPKEMQYVALGHLHRQHKVSGASCSVAYSGSPLAYSFSESNQTKFVNIVELEPAQEALIKHIPLTKGKPLLRATFSEVEEAVEWLQKHPKALVELSMQTTSYLSGSERKSIMQAHTGIVNLLPELLPQDGAEADNTRNTIDLKQSRENLFIHYFENTHKQPPTQELLDLFHEVLQQTDL